MMHRGNNNLRGQITNNIKDTASSPATTLGFRAVVHIMARDSVTIPIDAGLERLSDVSTTSTGLVRSNPRLRSAVLGGSPMTENPMERRQNATPNPLWERGSPSPAPATDNARNGTARTRVSWLQSVSNGASSVWRRLGSPRSPSPRRTPSTPSAMSAADAVASPPAPLPCPLPVDVSRGVAPHTPVSTSLTTTATLPTPTPMPVIRNFTLSRALGADWRSFSPRSDSEQTSAASATTPHSPAVSSSSSELSLSPRSALESWDDIDIDIDPNRLSAGAASGVNPMWGHGSVHRAKNDIDSSWVRCNDARVDRLKALRKEQAKTRAAHRRKPAVPSGTSRCCCGLCGPRCCPEVLCCSQDQRVRRCCLAVLAVLLALLPFIIYIAVDLAQLLDCRAPGADCFKMKRVEVYSMTSEKWPYQVAMDVDTPARTPVLLGTQHIKLRHATGAHPDLVFGSTAVTPMLQYDNSKSQPVMRRGKAQLKVDSEFELSVGDDLWAESTAVEEMAALAGLMGNQQQLQVLADVRASVGIRVLGMPLWMPPVELQFPFSCGNTSVDGAGFTCTLGEYPTSETFVAEEDDDGAAELSSDQPGVMLNSISVTDVTGSTASNDNDIWMVVNMTMGMGKMPVVAHVPPLDIALYYSPTKEEPAGPRAPHRTRPAFAVGRVDPFTMRGRSNGGAFDIVTNAAVPRLTDDTGAMEQIYGQQIEDLQQLVFRFTQKLPCHIFVKGAQELASTNSTEPWSIRSMRRSMLQIVTDRIQAPITREICERAGPGTTKNTADFERGTLSALATREDSSGDSVPAAQSTRFEPRQVDLLGLDASGEFSAGHGRQLDDGQRLPPQLLLRAQSDIVAPFKLTGSLPLIALDVYMGAGGADRVLIARIRVQPGVMGRDTSNCAILAFESEEHPCAARVGELIRPSLAANVRKGVGNPARGIAPQAAEPVAEHVTFMDSVAVVTLHNEPEFVRRILLGSAAPPGSLNLTISGTAGVNLLSDIIGGMVVQLALGPQAGNSTSGPEGGTAGDELSGRFDLSLGVNSTDSVVTTGLRIDVGQVLQLPRGLSIRAQDIEFSAAIGSTHNDSGLRWLTSNASKSTAGSRSMTRPVAQMKIPSLRVDGAPITSPLDTRSNWTSINVDTRITSGTESETVRALIRHLLQPGSSLASLSLLMRNGTVGAAADRDHPRRSFKMSSQFDPVVAALQGRFSLAIPSVESFLGTFATSSARSEMPDSENSTLFKDSSQASGRSKDSSAQAPSIAATLLRAELLRVSSENSVIDLGCLLEAEELCNRSTSIGGGGRGDSLGRLSSTPGWNQLSITTALNGLISLALPFDVQLRLPPVAIELDEIINNASDTIVAIMTPGIGYSGGDGSASNTTNATWALSPTAMFPDLRRGIDFVKSLTTLERPVTMRVRTSPTGGQALALAAAHDKNWDGLLGSGTGHGLFTRILSDIDLARHTFPVAVIREVVENVSIAVDSVVRGIAKREAIVANITTGPQHITLAGDAVLMQQKDERVASDNATNTTEQLSHTLFGRSLPPFELAAKALRLSMVDVEGGPGTNIETVKNLNGGMETKLPACAGWPTTLETNTLRASHVYGDAPGRFQPINSTLLRNQPILGCRFGVLRTGDVTVSAAAVAGSATASLDFSISLLSSTNGSVLSRIINRVINGKDLVRVAAVGDIGNKARALDVRLQLSGPGPDRLPPSAPLIKGLQASNATKLLPSPFNASAEPLLHLDQLEIEGLSSQGKIFDLDIARAKQRGEGTNLVVDLRTRFTARFKSRQYRITIVDIPSSCFDVYGVDSLLGSVAIRSLSYDSLDPVLSLGHRVTVTDLGALVGIVSNASTNGIALSIRGALCRTNDFTTPSLLANALSRLEYDFTLQPEQPVAVASPADPVTTAEKQGVDELDVSIWSNASEARFDAQLITSSNLPFTLQLGASNVGAPQDDAFARAGSAFGTASTAKASDLDVILVHAGERHALAALHISPLMLLPELPGHAARQRQSSKIHAMLSIDAQRRAGAQKLVDQLISQSPGAESLKLHLKGAFGASGKVDFQIRLPSSPSVEGAGRTTAEPKQVALKNLEILGAADQSPAGTGGVPFAQVPCILPGGVCPKQLVQTAVDPAFALAATLSVQPPAPPTGPFGSPVAVRVSSLSTLHAAFDCCTHTRIGTVQVDPFELSWSATEHKSSSVTESQLLLGLKVRVSDVNLLKKAVLRETEITYRIHGADLVPAGSSDSDDSNLLSSIFAQQETTATVAPNSPTPAPGADPAAVAAAVAAAAAIPPNPRDQWFLPATTHGNWQLLGTSRDSALLLVEVPIGFWGMEWPLLLRNVKVDVEFKGFVVAHAWPRRKGTAKNTANDGGAFDFEMRYGDNTMELFLEVSGDDKQAAQPCPTPAPTLAHRRTCFASAFINEISNGGSAATGHAKPLPLDIKVSFTNSLGVRQQLGLNLLFFEQPDFTGPTAAERLGIDGAETVPAFGDLFNGVKVHWASSIGSSLDIWNGVDIRLQISLKNVFGFNLRVNHLDIDINMHDLDGVDHFALGTYAKKNNVALLTDYVVDESKLNMVLPSGQVTLTPALDVKVASREKIARLVDDAYFGSKLCMGIRGGLDVWLEQPPPISLPNQALPPGALPLTGARFLLPVWFSLDPFSTIGSNDCTAGEKCFPGITPTHAFAALGSAEAGAVQFINGGEVDVRLRVVVERATNIPDKDDGWFVDTGHSDPYVQVMLGGACTANVCTTCGSSCQYTRSKSNEAHPIWNEAIDLGVVGKGRRLDISLWDSDAEFDDSILSGSIEGWGDFSSGSSRHTLTGAGATLHLRLEWTAITAPIDNARGLELTNGRNQNNAAWFKQKVSVVDSFEVRFQFTIDRVSWATDNGDGFAFVLQTAGVDKIGERCFTDSYCHGYKNLGGQSVAVLFDTFNANLQSGLSSDTIVLLTSDTGMQPVRVTSKRLNIDDGKQHEARIWYNALSRRLSVYLDGSQEALMVADLNMDTIFKGDQAWAGFTASTGTLAASTMRVRSFHYGTVVTDTTKSLLRESGQLLPRNQPSVVHINARDSCGNPRREGGDIWELRFGVGTQPDVFSTCATTSTACPLSSVPTITSSGVNLGQYDVVLTPRRAGALSVQGRLPPSTAWATLGTVYVTHQ